MVKCGGDVDKQKACARRQTVMIVGTMNIVLEDDCTMRRSGRKAPSAFFYGFHASDGRRELHHLTATRL